MVRFGGLVGALVGLTIQLIFTEWIFVDAFADQAFPEISSGPY
jgi:hypothetical protein